MTPRCEKCGIVLHDLYIRCPNCRGYFCPEHAADHICGTSSRSSKHDKNAGKRNKSHINQCAYTGKRCDMLETLGYRDCRLCLSSYYPTSDPILVKASVTPTPAEIEPDSVKLVEIVTAHISTINEVTKPEIEVKEEIKTESVVCAIKEESVEAVTTVSKEPEQKKEIIKGHKKSWLHRLISKFVYMIF